MPNSIAFAKAYIPIIDEALQELTNRDAGGERPPWRLQMSTLATTLASVDVHSGDHPGIHECPAKKFS